MGSTRARRWGWEAGGGATADDDDDDDDDGDDDAVPVFDNAALAELKLRGVTRAAAAGGGGAPAAAAAAAALQHSGTTCDCMTARITGAREGGGRRGRE